MAKTQLEQDVHEQIQKICEVNSSWVEAFNAFSISATVEFESTFTGYQLQCADDDVFVSGVIDNLCEKKGYEFDAIDLSEVCEAFDSYINENLLWEPSLLENDYGVSDAVRYLKDNGSEDEVLTALIDWLEGEKATKSLAALNAWVTDPENSEEFDSEDGNVAEQLERLSGLVAS